MQLSLGQAAKTLGVSKTTLSKAFKGGRLSASRNADHSLSIDMAELERFRSVYGHRFRPPGDAAGNGVGSPTAPSTPPSTSPTPAESAPEMVLLRERLEMERERVADLRSRLDAMQSERDEWRQQAQRLLLAAPLVTPPPPRAPAPQRSWWKWLRQAS